MRFKKIFITAFFTLLTVYPLMGQIQNGNEYQLATRLIQQQEYEEALSILKELVDASPEVYTYSDRLIECHIQLKQYDEALRVAQNQQRYDQNAGMANIRIGEIYHLRNDTSRAFKIWEQNLQEDNGQLQLYINTAQAMSEHKEYLKAVEVYRKAQEAFKNDRLFFSDIANTYMLAGEYEKAIEQWLDFLKMAPDRQSYVQRSLLRYDDPILYDITIVELDERLQEMSIRDEAYDVYFQLQIWLLQENKLFRRALVTAKAYENKSSNFNFSVFKLGRQLVDNNKFELARQAFNYYLNGNTYGEVKWRSMEELADTYTKWAKYLKDYNLDFTRKSDSLYRASYALLDSIQAETKNYSGIANIYIKQAEISLDFVFDLDAAKEAVGKLKNHRNMSDSPELYYLEGRIHLAQQEYTQARITLTKANKQAEIGELAEKTRYFLALTDFYSGDYEFAKIQLKSLGRQNTSYYANDALELRLWLQEGLSADTTGEQLDAFSRAVYLKRNGDPQSSTELFTSFISSNSYSMLKDDALLFLVTSDQASDTTKYKFLTGYLQNSLSTPIRERLLWEQAKLAERVNTKNLKYKTQEDMFFDGADANLSAREIYEKLILSYPQGFYAPYARERLTELNRENS